MTWSVHWINHAFLISNQSPCTRGQVGCVIVDQFNNPVSMGFNGPPRKAPGTLCNVDECERTKQNIKSGTQIEIGCHHAEQNALMNALRKGISVLNCSIYITTAPCLVCARLIHHAGIESVHYPSSSAYDQRGKEYLIKNNVKINMISVSK
tara:strand:- start:4802 stop:5254 length:453 start_codon:yes stop_codon:yes gene_type:complete